jgi:hypothetical protein
MALKRLLIASCNLYRRGRIFRCADKSRNKGLPMADELARARRFRSRAHEFQHLADTCGSARHAKHYHLIAKHFLALAHLEEDEVIASSGTEAPPIVPQSADDPSKIEN